MDFDIASIIKDTQSPSTTSKVKSDIGQFRRFLCIKNETRDPVNIEADVLSNYIGNFLGSVRKNNGSNYEPSTIMGFFQSIRKYLLNNSYKYDISRDVAFNECRDVLKAVCKSLKKAGGGTLPSKSDALEPEEINILFETRVLGCHNPRALSNAMAVNAMFLGCRGKLELYQRCLGDFLVVNINGEEYLTLSKERMTKTRNGENPRDVRHGVPKLKAIPGSLKCPVTAYKKIVEKRPVNFKHSDSPLFMRPNTLDPIHEFEETALWFTAQRMGTNEVSKIVPKLVNKAGINIQGRHITNRSIRKTVATTLIRQNLPTKHIMAQLGHRNPNSLVRYDTVSNEQVGLITSALTGERSVAVQERRTAEHRNFDIGVPQLLAGEPSADVAVRERQNVNFDIGVPQLLNCNDPNKILGSIFRNVGGNVNIQNFNVYNNGSNNEN